jgi:hypothetical protein
MLPPGGTGDFCSLFNPVLKLCINKGNFPELSSGSCTYFATLTSQISSY